MALDYMNVLNSLDLGLQSKQLFKKTMKRRPLGDIDTRHAVRAPRHPVLSMQLVSVNDVARKTTYRPQTSSDVVERQRENFHKLCARTVKSTNTPRPKHTEQQNRNRPYTTIIQVEGENTHRRKERPQSCPNKLLPSSWRNPAHKRPTSGPQRPKTSASSSSTPRTDSRLTLQIDPEYYEQSIAKRQCESAISDHRRDERHNLNVGIFVRGKKKEGQTDQNTQWLTFGGGVKNSTGVVDSFSVMNSDEYFSIDGRTGMVVAKHLQKKDKVQIGVNGRATKTSSSKAMQATQNAADEPKRDIPGIDEMNDKQEEKAPVPLCWHDQINKPEVKVCSIRGEQVEKPRPSVSETKPVVFSKLIKEEQPPPHLVSPRRMPSPDGYKVRQRTKIRKWLDGTETNFMTILSVDARGEEEDKDLELVDYEKLINDQFQPRGGGKKYPREGAPLSYKDIIHHRDMSGRKPSAHSTARSSTADSTKTGTFDPQNIVRPMSRSIRTGTLPDSPLLVTPANPTARTSPPVRTIVTSPQRQQSPQAGKIIRGKTSDKMGRTPPSISANYNQGDTSYIQIAQGVAVPPAIKSESTASHKDHGSGFHENHVPNSAGDYADRKQDFTGYYEDTAPPGMNTPVSTASHQVPTLPMQIKMAVDVPAVDMMSEVVSVAESDVKVLNHAESLQEIQEVEDKIDLGDPGKVSEDNDSDEEDRDHSQDARKIIPAPSPNLQPGETMEDPLENAQKEKTEIIEEKEFNISVSIKPREAPEEEPPEEGSVHADSGRQTPEN